VIIFKTFLIDNVSLYIVLCFKNVLLTIKSYFCLILVALILLLFYSNHVDADDFLDCLQFDILLVL
jgi:hypothetical protein